MKLCHIEDETCPTCNSRAVSESQRNQHSNGQWNEVRTFECGCELDWIPNYGQQQVRKQCPKSASVIDRDRNRAEASVAVMALLNSLPVDLRFREHIQSALGTAKYCW